MPDIRAGMKVIGVDGHNVGWVKTVQDAYFVLDKPKSSDLAVPFSACMKVEGDVVWLRVESTDVHRQGWQTAPAAGGPR